MFLRVVSGHDLATARSKSPGVMEFALRGEASRSSQLRGTLRETGLGSTSSLFLGKPPKV